MRKRSQLKNLSAARKLGEGFLAAQRTLGERCGDDIGSPLRLHPADGLLLERPDRRPQRRVVLRARAARCAGHVLTEGNTLLSDEELEMLVILRMNRDFMEFMRAHYNHLTNDHFGHTVVSPEDGEDSDEDEPREGQ